MEFSQNFINDQIIFLELCSRFSGVLHGPGNRSVKIRITGSPPRTFWEWIKNKITNLISLFSN